MLSRKFLLVLLVLGIILFSLGLTMMFFTHGDPTPVEVVVAFGGLLIGVLAWIGTLVRQAKQKQTYWFFATLGFGLLSGPGAVIGGGLCALIYLLIDKGLQPSATSKQPQPPINP